MHPFQMFHPFVLFSFFTFMIILTMFSMHPLFLSISLLGVISLHLTINPLLFFRSLKWIVPFCLIAAIINPLITHDGEKVLLYINYQPITLEALLYGCAMSVLILVMLLWCMALNALMTTDQFIYLFGKISPAVALLISITLRLIPLFKHQLHLIIQAQKAIGLDPKSGLVFQRIKKSMRVISILMTWVIENAIESADCMKARGYGLQGRTTFSIFTFKKRDSMLLVLIYVLGAIQIIGKSFAATTFDYYPTFTALHLSMHVIFIFSSLLVFVLLPTIIYVKERLKWGLLTSKISASRTHFKKIER